MIVIDSPGFYAAVILDHSRVVRAAPILKYMLGWSTYRVINYALAKGWRVACRFG